MNKKLIIGLGFAILISTFVLIKLFIQKERIERMHEINKPLQVGHKVILPDSLIDIFGNQVALEGIVLFLFFDPNCNTCVDEAPMWDDLHHRLGQKVRVLGISRGSEDLLKNFAARVGISYHMISDVKGIFFDQFHVSSIPYNLLVNDGKIAVIPSNINQSPSIRLKEVEDYVGL